MKFAQQIRNELPPRPRPRPRCKPLVMLAPDCVIVPYDEQLAIQAERDPPLSQREWAQEIGRRSHSF